MELRRCLKHMCGVIKCMNGRRLALAVFGVCVLLMACPVIYLETNTRNKLPYMLPQAAAYDRMAKASIEKAKTPVVATPLPDSSMGDRLKPMVVICVPTRSRADWWDLAETGLQTVLIPSIARTVTPAELDTYRVHMYLGINHDDEFWIENTAKLSKSDWLVVHAGFYKMTEHRVPFNEVTKAAYDDGAEYIVRINDDTEFITAAWITAGVKTLSGYDPPNVGVVGPTCNDGKTAIMTHDMVHRTHCDIFGDYYPPVFDNWFLDDWMTYVYEPGRSTKLRDWVAKHHTSKHGRRYSPNYDQRQLLNSEIEKGKVTILKYLQLRETMQLYSGTPLNRTLRKHL